jgi:hypothetical protein
MGFFLHPSKRPELALCSVPPLRLMIVLNDVLGLSMIVTLSVFCKTAMYVPAASMEVNRQMNAARRERREKCIINV